MFKILGTGHALPEKIIKNDELAQMVDTSDEWIFSRTGIKERRVLSDESLVDISVKASRLALENAGIKISEIDLIIFSTVFPDFSSPSMACLTALELDATCPAFDINCACTGFLYALDTAAAYFAAKKVKKVLIICGEQMSRVIDWTDRATCVLFGDAAGAVVLGEGDGLLSSIITCKPNDQFIRVPNAQGTSPFITKQFEKPFVKMNGQEVYKFAVTAACNDISLVTKQAELKLSDINYVILHQANMRIIDAAISMLKIPKEKFLNCIESTGNTSSATIPVVLDEANRARKFKKGDIIALSAFGAGLTTGAAIIKW